MPHTDDAGADQFIADTLRLATSLDTVSTRDWVERIAETIQQGRNSLKNLQGRCETLTVSDADAVMIERLLDTIHARLKFLEQLYKPQ